jgi:hypothetical protein
MAEGQADMLGWSLPSCGPFAGHALLDAAADGPQGGAWQFGKPSI